MRIQDSVPYRVRYQECKAVCASRTEAMRIVDSRWRKSNDWKSVPKRLREGTSLTDPLRRAALNLVLRRATGHP